MKHSYGLLLLMASAMATANDVVDINVEVTADAAACTPTLSNNGVADFGSRYAGSLSQKAFNQLGTRDLSLNISCESATTLAITARDTRADSMNSGKDESGNSGARFTINGGGYISDVTRLFGLGLTPENKKIGSYAVQLNNSGIVASDAAGTVNVAFAGAKDNSGPWSTSTTLPLPVSQDYYYTFVQLGTTTPQPIMTATVPLQVSAVVAPDLGSGQRVQLDGEAVISLVYL